MDYCNASMKKDLKDRMMNVCHQKILKKGPKVGLSFYAFFSQKNDKPEELLEVAIWWIKKHQLDHFEKAEKILQMLQKGV